MSRSRRKTPIAPVIPGSGDWDVNSLQRPFRKQVKVGILNGTIEDVQDIKFRAVDPASGIRTKIGFGAQWHRWWYSKYVNIRKVLQK